MSIKSLIRSKQKNELDGLLEESRKLLQQVTLNNPNATLEVPPDVSPVVKEIIENLNTALKDIRNSAAETADLRLNLVF